ncbi:MULTISPECIES: fibronectin type III domain-containing protein [unclassified Actinoplanes]|uniref:fibronectin type III domain-containing protein n=1 Tax=unclassified Actinoplanes TaxID=2626549 RepID=UPI0009B03EF2|nr:MULTISPECIES: fibronectin type III domain-containing protein [unclassified Actinoplanes]
MGTVLALAGGLGLTVLGLGQADKAVASFDAASWVWSRAKGEMSRVNGVTARIDTRVDVGQARGHGLEVTQSDRFVILRDVNTGAIGSMDLTDLQTYWNQRAAPGVGVSVALHNDTAFIVDSVQGRVQQVDPASLQGIGQPITLPPGITGGQFDGRGRLWVVAPSEGTVIEITPAPRAGAGTAAQAQRVRTETVGGASHDFKVTTLDDGVAVLDRTTNELVRVGDTPTTHATLPLTGPGTLAAHTDGGTVAVTVPDTRQVVGVDPRGGIKATFTVRGGGTQSQLQPAVSWEGFYYVADADGGTVHVFDQAGQEQKPIVFQHPGGSLELDVREGYLFINAPGSSIAQVVDNQHGVRPVDKYADDVPGGTPPKVTTPPTPPRKKPVKPAVTKPGAPRNVRAAAGNAEARVTWQAAPDNGAAIAKYVVSGNNQTFTVGAEQRAYTVTGLTNGETYTFQVHAVNAKGDGPDRSSNPVKPTSEVPDPPGTPQAAAKPDGSVTVTWPAANGQGLAIDRYTVTAVSEGGTAPVGDAKDTSISIPAGQLDFGKQYAFTVVSVNEHGAGSKSSAISNSVVPFSKPGKPDNLDAATVADQPGAIRVTWAAPADNGRPISRYVVTAGGRSTDVADGTAATLTGFGAGETVAVQVVAVNEAGPGDPASATARTVAAPTVTITGTTTTFNAATVGFSVNAGGGTAACSLAVSGGTGSGGSCSSLKASGLKPGTDYTFTVTVKNAAGTVTKQATKATADLYGTATCINGSTGDQKTYCNADVDGRNGNEIFTVTRQNDAQQAGWVPNGTRLKTYCKKSGEEVYAFVYNNNKRSTWWIQIDYKGKTYIPWAWLNLDGGDDLGNLPNC